MAHYRQSEGGVVLIVVLLLVAILTMLAVAGAGTATAELAMAGNEQYRRRALDAASAGIEQQLALMRSAAGRPGSTPTVTGPVAAGAGGADRFSTSSRYVGSESFVAGSSIGKFSGHHFVIVSTGRSLRGAVDVQAQGALIVSSDGGVTTLGRSGSGVSE